MRLTDELEKVTVTYPDQGQGITDPLTGETIANQVLLEKTIRVGWYEQIPGVKVEIQAGPRGTPLGYVPVGEVLLYYPDTSRVALDLGELLERNGAFVTRKGKVYALAAKSIGIASAQLLELSRMGVTR